MGGKPAGPSRTREPAGIWRGSITPRGGERGFAPVAGPRSAGFDQLNTSWAERGSILIQAASRSPEAANQLLRAEDNAKLLTSNEFGWREATMDFDQETPWDVVGGPSATS